jgi:hypothetical protein
VESVVSVDLVADPATVSGLFEAREQTMNKALLTKPVREWIAHFQTLKPGTVVALRPDYAKRLQEMEGAGVLTPEMPMAEPGEGGGSDSDQALKDGFKAAVMAAVEDDSLDMAGKLAKIKELLKAQEKLMAPKEAPAPAASSTDGGSGGESGTSEAKAKELAANLQEQVKRLTLQVQVKDELAASGMRPTKVLTKALDACATLQEAKDLIADVKADSGRPRSSAPAGNGTAGDKPLPKSPKELREQYAR